MSEAEPKPKFKLNIDSIFNATTIFITLVGAIIWFAFQSGRVYNKIEIIEVQLKEINIKLDKMQDNQIEQKITNAKFIDYNEKKMRKK